MTIKELKEKCREQGLKVSGTKKQLVERLANPDSMDITTNPGSNKVIIGFDVKDPNKLKLHPLLLSLMGVPISYFFIIATRLGYQGFNNVLWAQRLLGFGLGIFIFAGCTWFFIGEGIATKTIVSLTLAVVLVMIQVFWK